MASRVGARIRPLIASLFLLAGACESNSAGPTTSAGAAGSDGGAPSGNATTGGSSSGGEAASGGGGQGGAPPDCNGRLPVDPPGDGGSGNDPNTPQAYVPSGCQMVPKPGGTCTHPVDATLTLAGQPYLLERACAGSFNVQSWADGEDWFGAAFSLTPGDSCAPAITVVLLDGQRYCLLYTSDAADE